MTSATDITSKSYKKLHLRVAPTGFSYGCLDTLSNRFDVLSEITFPANDKSPVEELYQKAFAETPELKQKFDDVLVLHDNNLTTFVPKPLFDEEYLGSYLQYNTQVFETDFFAFDEIPGYDMCNVYIPYVNLNNFLIDQYGPFTYKSMASVLVERLLNRSKNVEELQVYAHFGQKYFQLIVVQNQKLLLFNTFEYRAKEDFLYYLLFAAEQLRLNPETFALHLLGNVEEQSDFYAIAYKYVRYVSMLDMRELSDFNGRTEQENRRHFVLLPV